MAKGTGKESSGKSDAQHMPKGKGRVKQFKTTAKGGGRGHVHDSKVFKGTADGDEQIVGGSQVGTKAAGNSFGL